MTAQTTRRAAPLRYRPASGPESSADASPALLNLAAPLAGSRLVFPRLLARSLDQARRTGAASFVANAHARWFFGASLLFWTDPAKLALRLRDRVDDGRGAIQLSRRFVDSGDWTGVVEPVADTVEHRETIELVAHGDGYRGMPSFQRMMRRMRRGKPVHRFGFPLDSQERIDAYFRYFLELIDSIRTHGLQECGSLPGLNVPVGSEVRGAHARNRRNIGVAVAADGSLLRFLGGRHRLAVAQALGLAAIPVEIRFVHSDWLIAEMERSGLGPAAALQAWARRVPRPQASAAGVELRPADLACA